MDSLKLPLALSLNDFARKKVFDQLQIEGKALPATVVSVAGSIVTVEFAVTSLYTLPQITCPLFGPEYIRYPIQKNCRGVVFAADVYMGGMSGLGGGTADLSQRANLTTLVFFPCGNVDFFEVDPNALVAYGPNGVVLRDQGGASTLTLTPTDLTTNTPETVTINAGTSITLNVGGINIVINSEGVFIQGILWLPHTHGGVVTGGANTTGVTG